MLHPILLKLTFQDGVKIILVVVTAVLSMCILRNAYNIKPSAFERINIFPYIFPFPHALSGNGRFAYIRISLGQQSNRLSDAIRTTTFRSIFMWGYKGYGSNFINFSCQKTIEISKMIQQNHSKISTPNWIFLLVFFAGDRAYFKNGVLHASTQEKCLVSY